MNEVFIYYYELLLQWVRITTIRIKLYFSTRSGTFNITIRTRIHDVMVYGDFTSIIIIIIIIIS